MNRMGPLDSRNDRPGKRVPLTTDEFDLLAAFVNPRLRDLARNREGGPFDRTIDVKVERFRRKLRDDPEN